MTEEADTTGAGAGTMPGLRAAAQGVPSLDAPPFRYVVMIPDEGGRVRGSCSVAANLRGFILGMPHHVEISLEQYELLKHSSDSYRMVAGELEVIPPPAPTLEELELRNRTDRDRRLAASDWMVQPDVPASDEKRAARLAYRQALRDITVQPGWPAMVEWPTVP